MTLYICERIIIQSVCNSQTRYMHCHFPVSDIHTGTLAQSPLHLISVNITVLCVGTISRPAQKGGLGHGNKKVGCSLST